MHNENPISNWLSKTKDIPVEITYRCIDGTMDNPPCVEIKMKLNSTHYNIGKLDNYVSLHGCKHYAISFIPCFELNDTYIAERLDAMYKECCEIFHKL